jgi:hypothetical protein
VAAAWLVPGASYLTMWPIVGGILAVSVMSGSDRRDGQRWWRTGLAWVFGIPTALMVWPLVSALFDTMGLAPQSGAAIAVIAAFGLASLAACAEIVSQGRRWWPAGLGAVAALVSLGVGAGFTRYSSEHPQPVNLYYALDANTGEARWAARVPAVDSWIGSYLGARPRTGRPAALVPPWSTADGTPGFLNGPAPKAELGMPSATVTGSAVSAGGRVLTLHVKPAQEGHVLSVWTNGAPVIDASFDGRPIKLDRAPRATDDTAFSLDWLNASAAGGILTLTVRGTQRLTVDVVDRWVGLPEFPSRTFEARPPASVPIQLGDTTVVRRRYTF